MVAINSPDPDNNQQDNKAAQLVMRLSSRETVTAMQIQTLLGAMTVLGNLRMGFGLRDADGIDEQPEFDGGVNASLDVSMMNICDRIDAIVAQASRWDMKTQDQMETKLKKIYDTQLEALQAQKEACDNARAPHVQFKPEFRQLGDSKWTAAFARDLDPEGKLTGFGQTPAEALLNLHRNFYEGLNS